MKIVVVTGPESSGKTTLSRALASQITAPWVEEYARDFLERLGRPYEQHDLLAIARGQEGSILQAARSSSQAVLVCDTDLTVVRIWSEVRYGECHPWITERLRQRPADLYLLCRPDIPWTFDPLREHPHERDKLFHRYSQLLTNEQFPFVTIGGSSLDNRIQQAVNAVKSLMS